MRVHSRTSRAVRAAFFVVIGLALIVGARAEPAVRRGAVVSVRGGNLERWSANAWRSLEAGDAIAFGEKLRTTRGAVAVLSLPGQGRFVVGPASELTLGADAASSRTRLDRGSVWVQAALEPGRRMAVVAPVGVAGVRGTRFSVLADDDGAAFCTCTGRVDIELGDSRVIPARTGQFVPVDSGSAPPGRASSDRRLLNRPRGDRYDWCFTCHEIGGRGRLKRGWSIDGL